MHESDRTTLRWLGAFLLLGLMAACGFPRPKDVGDDDAAAPVGCMRDQDCSSPTPFCVNAACAACRDSTSCPGARPVCDLVSHDCRTCAADSECDSGACDLAAGKCVDQGAILYAAPGGTNADPCTRGQPCSLLQVARAVDPAHPYIVLVPGTYPQGELDFTGKTATVCGSGATLDADQVSFNVSNGSSVRLRNFKMLPSSSSFGIFGIRGIVIFSSNSDLTIDDADLELTLPVAVQGGPTITIRNSVISHGLVDTSGALVIDRSTFVSGAAIQILGNGSAVVFNSVFVSSPGAAVIQIDNIGDTTSRGEAYVANSTFSGGGISCNGGPPGFKTFDSNIFYNIDPLVLRDDCNYTYNLIVPSSTVAGANNITGDPLFVDAAHGDFHLRAGSPAIGAANPSPVEANGHDRDGKPRPQGQRAALGAYETVP